MTHRPFLAALAGCLVGMALSPVPCSARVVINEILYHAPGDLDDLEFVELHNSGEDAVDVSGWTFTKGLKYTFPPGARIEPGGFLVLCRNEASFRRHYPSPVAGTFQSKLSNHGERLELSDARGRIVDTVKYQDTSPWPIGADGQSGSLERICPDSGGDNVLNWASSPLSPDLRRPAGSPGRTNASYAAELPPAISHIKVTPEFPLANEPFRVEARIRDTEAIAGAELAYRIVRSGQEAPEVRVPLAEAEEGLFAATVPGQPSGTFVRYRLLATGSGGARRAVPADTEPRPAFTAWVRPAAPAAPIATLWIVDPGPRRQPGASAGNLALLLSGPAPGALAGSDFASLLPRKNGFELQSARGHALAGLSEMRLEPARNEWTLLAEPIACTLHREAGAPAPESRPVQVLRDGATSGLHLLAEEPNRDFFRRHQFDDDGIIVKGAQKVTGTPSKRRQDAPAADRSTNATLEHLITSLASAPSDAARWDLIRRQLDVARVIHHLAARTFVATVGHPRPRYVAYHDEDGTGRWTVHARDFEHALGDGTPAAGAKDSIAPWTAPLPPAQAGPDDDLAGWLLATPGFRRLYVARLREWLSTVATDEALGAQVDTLAHAVREVWIAQAVRDGLTAPEAGPRLDRARDGLKAHLRQRRAFLLAQDEIKTAGTFSIEGLEKPVAKKAAAAAAAAARPTKPAEQRRPTTPPTP